MKLFEYGRILILLGVDPEFIPTIHLTGVNKKIIMKEELARVNIAMRKITQFSENTRKVGVEKLNKNDQAALRMELLTRYWEAYESAHEELMGVVTPEEEATAEYFVQDVHFDIEQAFLEAAGEIRALTGTLRCANGAPAVVNQPRAQQANACAIRPIEPPSFSGDVTTWTSFRDLFTNLIINNESLGNVQRMHYLKSSCKGEAEEILRNFAVTEANFVVAWEALRKRFENNRIIISKLIEQIFALPVMRNESAGDLKHLIDGTNQSLRALHALERDTDRWGDMLVVHTVGKLDLKTRQVWERHIAQTVVMPTFEDLSEFLEGELRSLEAIQCMASSSQVHTKQKVVRAHVVETKMQCVLCKGLHALYACEKFIAMPVEERREIITREKICFNCISTDRHVSKGCKSKFLCKICQRKHHTMLHVPENTSAQDSTTAGNAAVNIVQQPMVNMLLATALIKIKAPFGWVNARALIDPGSQVSLATENIVQQLRVPRSPTRVNVIGVGNAKAGECKGNVALRVCSRLNDEGVDVTAFVMRRITGELPAMATGTTSWPHIGSLQLADVTFGKPGPIDVLLGADVYQSLLVDGVRKGQSGPVAQNTIFGWVLTGPTNASSSRASINVSSMHVCIDTQLRKFWEIEEGNQERTPSMEDAACERHFLETAKRESDGRYTLQMPFATTTKTLGESRSMAVRRLLQIERRYAGQREHFDQYAAFMEEYLSLGHMEVAKQPAPATAVYLAHHAIHKPTSTSTKLRVVFDASQATSSGHSLNDVLMTGPRLQDDLWDILVRWRKHKIALSADVHKMYRQFWIADEHRDFQRIVWRRTPAEPIREYRLKTITYGTSSAPYMAVRAMHKVADDERQQYPLAAEVVKRDFYMDDVLTGADTDDAAVRLKDQLLGLMQSGGLPLLKWSSNSPQVLRTIPEEHREIRSSLDIELDDTVKTLGVYWQPGHDHFGYKVSLGESEGVVTKRKVLSAIAKIYDPLSLLAPIIVTAKMFLQQLWLAGIDWDDDVPESVRTQWCEYRAQLPNIEAIHIARWIGLQGDDTFEMHGFSDASKDAYAACVYLRIMHKNGEVSVALVAAKTKVAPIKQISVPRLELNGAVLLCRLLGAVQKAMQLPRCRVAAWTDSAVVLAWLQGHANRWPTFVANRVSFIQTAMEISDWRHVPGADNPADVASRGIMPAALATHPLWWCGPSWLHKDEQHWPERRVKPVEKELLEEKMRSCATTMRTTVWDFVKKYSSLNQLLRMTAYLRRTIRYTRDKGEGEFMQIQADELQDALMSWVRQVQKVEFGEEMEDLKNGEQLPTGTLRNLKAFVDENELLRVGGRLQNCSGTYDEKHPLILPHRGELTMLIIADAHNKVMHYGPKQTIGHLQQRFWILGVRNAVKAHIRQCVICYRTKPRSQHQLMGSLPAARVTPSRAFLHTAIDYAGPIWTRTSKGRGHKANKAWIAVFICLASKAMHLELVSDLTTASFIAAFRRFTARRGHCSDIYCDNGTNFVGAAGELERMLQCCVKNAEWHREVSADGSRFHFAPPGSPHFNGLAEAAVKLAKTSLRKIIGEHTLTFEEMCTFLAQAEAVLNSRPIGALTRDRDDFAPLTPGHLLIGRPLTAVPEANLLNETTMTYACRWKLVQRLAQQFWRRWSTEYVHALQQRAKWQTLQRIMRIGDVVIVRDELLPATKWKLGRIEDVHPGADGVIRVVSVRSGSSVLKRSIVKLCVLPILDNSVDNDDK